MGGTHHMCTLIGEGWLFIKGWLLVVGGGHCSCMRGSPFVTCEGCRGLLVGGACRLWAVVSGGGNLSMDGCWSWVAVVVHLWGGRCLVHGAVNGL